MKPIVLCLFVYLWNISCVYSQQHPCMYACPADKESIKAKIESEAWAYAAFSQVRQKVEKYADRHRSDPEWMVSRFAMYWEKGKRYTQCYLKNQNWDRGEGDAPVPTVRMPGMRTWNKFVNVPLEQRIPYNKTGDMLGINKLNPAEPPVMIPYKESGHMVRSNNVEILSLAENAAFVYWITDEEKYARFAADIFNTWLVGTYYMNPILDPEKSCGSTGGWEPGGICGYYDYEQIHDELAMHAAVVYDFLFDYLKDYPHPHLRIIGKSTKEVTEEVFRRFIELGLIRGDKKGNWNVNGWNMILRPILTLDSNDAYVDGKGKEYYLNFLLYESTAFHEAIPDMVKNYNPITGLWPESPGYAFSTIQMILDWSVLLKRAGIDIIADYPILQKAAMAAFPWMDERANLMVFGDSRGGNVNFKTFENLLTYYSATGQEENAGKVAEALNKGVALNKYSRVDAGWPGICTYTPMIPADQPGLSERASYSSHHRFIVMKNWDKTYKLMATLYGGKKGYHLSANGLALQFYGYGYALAPDAAAYESYWSRDYAYHQGPLGANTILPGYTEGSINILAMEPEVDSTSFSTTRALTPYLNFADVEAAEKRRTVALMSVSDEAGYYVDIFRSDLEDNDFLFHNVGTALALTDGEGRELSSQDVDRLELLSGDTGSWFTEKQISKFDGNFKADWTLPQGITSRLWMTGNEGRSIYRMNAPSTTLVDGLTPDDCGKTPNHTPVLLVRQIGSNAKSRPFMSVYESFKNSRPAVIGVRALLSGTSSVGIEVGVVDNRKDYFLSAEDKHTRVDIEGISLRGSFAQITVQDKEICSFYLGSGFLLEKDGCRIEVLGDNPVYAAVYRQENEIRCSATVRIRLTWQGKDCIVEAGLNQCIE